jgi:hypothetical protein
VGFVLTGEGRRDLAAAFAAAGPADRLDLGDLGPSR